MKKWEYRIELMIMPIWEVTGGAITTMQKMGDEGWELIQIITPEIYGQNSRWIFKRPKEEWNPVKEKVDASYLENDGAM